ncbi:uncharacterized protein LOC116339226 isoform X2 [Contarinia nasturtii]|uniref:uncharacterized protein LOC116339226 isoform X2 n=1 Tax=Contarinia nasturtii TaxID=265458 RepID=UPI0012D3FE6B|nr:uncharacterized protein LOC116339226 isoform X2 [Contarinia nasturtii]
MLNIIALNKIWQLSRKISTLKVLSTAKELVKKGIQAETQTTIKCSKIKSNGVNKRLIEITGATHQNVYTARKQIKAIDDQKGDNKQKRSQPTHFTCVKITNPTIQENYAIFKDSILSNENIKNFPEAAFMKQKKLHITFGVMLLTDADNHNRAKQILNDCHENIVKPVISNYGKITINVHGLEIMKGNPNKARVVYAKIESEALQKVADGITTAFIDAGLAKQESNRNAVKLHMTVINVKYTKNKTKSIDATHILEHYGDFEFGSQDVNHIHLASMQHSDTDGFYRCIASIEFE